MRRVHLRHIRIKSPDRLGPLLSRLPEVLLGLFALAALLVWVRLPLPSFLFGPARWPEAVLLVLGAATVAAGLARQLPAQNVLAVCALILAASSGLFFLSLKIGIPFGKQEPSEELGRQIYWAVPLIWLTALLCARGVARLVLRPMRRSPSYGYWRLSVAVLLAVLFDLTLEPFATTSQKFWAWQPTRISWDWFGTPWINFLGWAVSALLILAFATPILINKSPIKPPPDYFPFWVWLGSKLVFTGGAIMQRLWAVAALGLGEVLLVAVLVTNGALRQNPSRGRRTAPRPKPVEEV